MAHVFRLPANYRVEALVERRTDFVSPENRARLDEMDRVRMKELDALLKDRTYQCKRCGQKLREPRVVIGFCSNCYGKRGLAARERLRQKKTCVKTGGLEG